MKQEAKIREYSPWPHRMAMLLVCATFPLIWVGGLVTTYDAGMAVPDWPATFGYNLFLYPWESWIAGPWDLFIEHGHRLLGALVGFIAIGFLITTLRCEDRRWMRNVAWLALGLVVLQGLLGGQRVLRNDRSIAQLHGILGPMFFAFSSAVTVWCSNWWRNLTTEQLSPRNRPGANRSLALGCWILASLALLQLVLGSILRHGIEYVVPTLFRSAVLAHVVIAIAVLIHAVVIAIKSFRTTSIEKLQRPACLLATCVICQFLLGIGSWAVKYGWPTYFENLVPQPSFLVMAQSMKQSLIVTGHVAMGSLILALSVVMGVRSSRVLALRSQLQSSSLRQEKTNGSKTQAVSIVGATN